MENLENQKNLYFSS